MVKEEEPYCETDLARAFSELNYDTVTVGYGDEYPRPDAGSNLVFELSNQAGGIGHILGEQEYGLNLTTFGSGASGRQAFAKVLQAVGLHPVDDFVRVYRDLGYDTKRDYPPRYLYVWVTEDVLIACTNNPFTADGSSEAVSTKPGDAGYIGISGTEDAATTAVEAVQDAMESTKEGIREEMFW